MRAVVLLPDRDTAGKKDYSSVFRPEALAFARLHEIPLDDVVEVNLGRSKSERRAEVVDALKTRAARKDGPIECVAFFCHGLRSGLPQLGLGTEHVDVIAGAVASAKHPGMRVAIYACSTASGASPSPEGEPGGDGGFADRLRDALCRAGAVDCVVDAHASAGHATRNPHVRRFEGGGSPVGGIGGRWLVAPGSTHWKAWVAALHGQGNLHLRFPLASREQVELELEGQRGP